MALPKDEKPLTVPERPPPKVRDVTFAGVVRVGQRQETFMAAREHWMLDVDMVARVVIVSRRDINDRVDTSIVPFENVAFICYEPEQPA